MPSLGYRFDDDEVAAVVTYVRNSWGNDASPVSADTVRPLRSRITRAAQ
jgi:mono/diheme cytochrome c family protein